MCRALRINFRARPAWAVRQQAMLGNTLQRAAEIAAVSFWVSTECVAIAPLRAGGDYQAFHARVAEMIRTSNSS